MPSERGLVIGDLLDGFADATLHRDAGALHRRAGATGAASKTDRARELLDEHVELAAGTIGTADVREALGLLDFRPQLDDAPLVLLTGLGVQDLARVTPIGDAPFVVRFCRKIEDMELLARVVEQACQYRQAAHRPQACRPAIALDEDFIARHPNREIQGR